MKNKSYLFLFLLLVFPMNIRAETYYTEYEPYLLNQSERIETNDLIKEEIIENYYIKEEVKVNTGYYPENSHFDDKPYVDYNDKIIASKRETFYQQSNYTKALLYSTDQFLVKSFTIDNILVLPKFVLYDLNYKKLEYSLNNNLITLDEEIEINKLIIIFEIENDCQFTINFTNGGSFNVRLLKYPKGQYEINFVLKNDMTLRLQKIGVYTSAIFPVFEYNVYYTYHYLYYDKGYEEVLTLDKNLIYSRKELLYNYYSRDKLVIDDYLLLDKNNQDLSKIVNYSSIPLENIMLNSNVNYNVNGVYELSIVYKNIDLTKPLFILNKEEPVIIEKETIIEKTCEPVIIEKETIIEKTCEPSIITKEKIIPGKTKIISRPCNIKYPIKEEKKESAIKQVSENKAKNNFKYAYVLPIVPFLSTYILLRKKKKNNIH